MQQEDIDQVMRMQRPESVVFVLSVDKNGRPSGQIVGWNMRCSYQPSIIAVGISEKNYTHELIQESKEFVVAVANKGMEKAVDCFGSTHGNEVDKFKETDIKTAKSKFIRTPLLADATLNFECKLVKELKLGDHYIFFGEVVAAYYNKGKKVLLNMGKKRGIHYFEEF